MGKSDWGGHVENKRSLKIFKLIGYRLITTLVLLFGITLFTFFLLSMSKVDATDAYIHRNIMKPDPETVKIIQHKLGLDAAVHIRYLNWLKDIIHLDFGNSFVTGEDVLSELLTCFSRTIKIVFISVFIMLTVSIPLGVIAASKRDTHIDNIISLLSMVALSMPSYWFGFVLIYLFSIKITLFPFVFQDNLSSYILPAIALSIPFTGIMTKMIRSNFLERLNDDFVTYAVARGIPKRKILFSHILKNSAVSLLALLGQNISNIFVGTAIIETVFSIKGLGRYGLDAIFSRDNPAINGYVLFIALSFAVINIITDILIFSTDRRVGAKKLL